MTKKEFKEKLVNFGRTTKEATKKTFKNFGKVITKPVTVSRELVEPNGVISGLVLMLIKCIVFLIWVYLWQNSWGPFNNIFPTGVAVLFAIISTLGLNLIETLLIRGFSALFRAKLNFKEAFVCVGIGSIYSLLVWILAYILSFITPIASLAILILCIPVPYIVTFAVLFHLAKGKHERKVFTYIFTRMLMFILSLATIGAFAFFFVSTLLSNIVDAIMNYINNLDIMKMIQQMFF